MHIPPDPETKVLPPKGLIGLAGAVLLPKAPPPVLVEPKPPVYMSEAEKPVCV